MNRASRAGLQQFFEQAEATAFIIVGHTDSRASDDYNLKLSYKRASAVAYVGQTMGRRISDVRGLGERNPIAKNNTSRGMAKNRRVEILCIR